VSRKPPILKKVCFDLYDTFMATLTSSRIPEHEDESSVKVKLKLMSMWNNVKYGKTMFSVVQSSSGSFSGHHPVWVLGKFYQRKRNSDEVALYSFK